MSSTVVFGWHLDGPTYPETAGGTHFSLGDSICGPLGLLDLLEIQFGLSYPPVSPAVRAAQYLARLRSVDDGRQFYSSSLQVDPWATAIYMLRKRDELVFAGWKPHVIGLEAPRLRAMAALEEVEGIKLKPGLADRLLEVLQALRSGARPKFARLRVATPMKLLPPVWQEILRSIKSSGVHVEEMALRDCATGGDLLSLQRTLSGSAGEALTGDGSLAVLESDDELQASLAMAAWLAAHLQENADLVIIRGPGCSLLDEACEAFGLPRPGGATASRWRATLQVLPLAVENMWSPINPSRLLEFLSLPQSPIPRSVSYFFKEALREQPGVGGSAWKEAWQKSSERWRDRLAKGGLTQEEIEKQLEEDMKGWRHWLEPERFDPDSGMPVSAAEKLCRRVQKWASGRAHQAGQSLHRDLIEHCAAFSEAINESRLTSLTRVQAQRILDTIGQDGSRAAGSGAQAAPWTVIDHPGQLWEQTRSVLWWGFVDGGDPLAVDFWTYPEKEELRRAGVELEDLLLRLFREAASWRRAISLATEQLILVRPGNVDGEPARVHPFWHEVRPLLASEPGVARKIVCKANEVLDASHPVFARRRITSVEIQETAPPEAQRYWRIGQRTLVMPPKESATSIARLLGCPLSWLLGYSAGLRLGVLLDLPDEERLAGNLAHAVIAELFAERARWDEEAAARQAMALFDRAVPAVAAPLLLPGRNLELDRFRKALERGVRSLVRLLNGADLHVVGCEVKRTAQFGDTAFEGTLDLLCKDGRGRLIVLDLKWTRSPERRRKEIQEGKALQLAAYSWLVEGESTSPPRAGYFMLRTGRLLFTDSEPFPAESHISGTDLRTVWESARSSYRFHIDTLSSGLATATGVSIPEEWEKESRERHFGGLLDVDPPCRFCEFNRICAIKETTN